MTAEPPISYKIQADRKIFLPLLLLFSVIYAVQDLPRMLSSKQAEMDILATILIIIIDVIAMYILRYLILKGKSKFLHYILMILTLVVLANFLQWTSYGFLRQIYGTGISWTQIYQYSIVIGVKESWFLFTWAVLYISFMLNAESQYRAIALERANTLAHQAQLSLLRYQLNPHFLFNTLNSLSALVLQKRNVEAEEVLINLSRFLRYTLDYNANQMVPLSEEINAQKHYLEIEHARFRDRLDITFDLQEGLENACVPSLLIQPMVENSIKHAIGKMKRGGKITIRAKAVGNMLELIVEDNGPGNADPMALLGISNNGVGIQNTAERLSLLYPEQGKLKLETVKAGGFRAIITIPLEYESAQK